jgi:hypothetical protein
MWRHRDEFRSGNIHKLVREENIIEEIKDYQSGSNMYHEHSCSL